MNAFVETLRNLGPVRLAMMGAVAAGIFAFFIYLTSQLATGDMALLYGNLDAKDSGEIVSRLEQVGVPYQLAGDGSRIMVPADQVARLRLSMAEEGLPNGGSVGYEIFDRSEGIGTSNFVQNVNRLRALEGELARTIRSIRRVENARVHLVLPQRRVFTRDREEASASVVLLMQGSARLNEGQVTGLRHLVAAAVPGLQPEMVSIIDEQGTLLARGGEEDGVLSSSNNAQQMRADYEQRMARTVEELVERSVGPGNVRAEVAAEMDFDRITENAEIFDPESQIARSTQIVEEEESSVDSEGQEPVTVGGNLPDAELPQGAAAGSQSQSTRTQETVNYEISKTVKTHVRETGVIRRLSVAVLVDGAYVEGPDGEQVYEPRSEEEMQQIRALVRSAVGFDEARGDTIEVANMRFADPTEELEAAGTGGFLGITQNQLMRVAEVLVLGIVAVLVLLLVVRPLVGRMLEAPLPQAAGDSGHLLSDDREEHAALSGPRRAPVQAQGGAQADDEGGMTDIEQSLGEDESEGMIDINKVEGRVRASSVRKIGEIVEKHPEEAVSIVRNWLYQQG